MQMINIPARVPIGKNNSDEQCRDCSSRQRLEKEVNTLQIKIYFFIFRYIEIDSENWEIEEIWESPR